MPELSRFFGILITMYFKEHMPPHFHAWYSGHKAEFDFDGNIIAGEMPPKQSKMIAAWAVMYADELALAWEDCRTGNNPQKIRPLM